MPSGSDADMTQRIENQMEHFAPGFRNRIITRHTFTAKQMEEYNANYLGGDINSGGSKFMANNCAARVELITLQDPRRGFYICSSATPPGGGVHEMCGYYPEAAMLKNELAEKQHR